MTFYAYARPEVNKTSGKNVISAVWAMTLRPKNFQSSETTGNVCFTFSFLKKNIRSLSVTHMCSWSSEVWFWILPGLNSLTSGKVSQAQKSKESGDERSRLRASQCMPPTSLFPGLNLLTSRKEMPYIYCSLTRCDWPGQYLPWRVTRRLSNGAISRLRPDQCCKQNK